MGIGIGIFIHGTDVVDRGLIVLFSVFFPLPPTPPERGLIVLFFGIFCYFWSFFSLPPTPSADALACASEIFAYGA